VDREHRAALTASEEKQSLGTFMPQLLTSEFGAGGQLPQTFVVRLRWVAGSSIDDIFAKYVGP
jgi:hypothetical protein